MSGAASLAIGPRTLSIDGASAATLVIVREAMHHLGYERARPRDEA